MRNLKLAAAALAVTAASYAAPAAADSEHLIADEPLNLTIHMHHKRYPAYNEDWPVEKAACRMTNICLKNATIGSNSTDSREAMNLLLASGSIPDIVGSANIKEYVMQYGPQGAFMPLNDLIEKHAPNLKAWFDERPKIRAAISAADGNMYYIPYLMDGKYARAWFIRYDWLEKLGLDVPQNVHEYKEVLSAFRNRDPNGNGLKDEIPFFARNWEEVLRLVTLWDGRSTGSGTPHDFYVNDGKVTHPYVGEGYREGVRNIAIWYAEGLIDPEVFTRGSSAREYLLSENLGGSTHDWFASTSGYNTTLQPNIEGFEFKAFAPPASISGVRIEENRRTPYRADGWAIGGANKNPVETIKYFDFFFTPEGRNLSVFGVEGEFWTMVDGKPTFKEEILTNGRPVNSQLYEVGALLHARGYWMDYGYELQWTNEYALEGINLYDQADYLIDEFLGVALNAEEQRVYDKHWPQIRTYMLERQQAWILGSADIEAEWDGYIAQLRKMGMDEVLEAMNSAYVRQYSG